MSNMCYDLQSLSVQFTDQKKKQLKKKLRIETNSSYFLTTRNLQYHHWP